ncbi:hypothetical protein DPMN_122099 [Dreissena polymorpha]|uniref:Uncharacterized protein n=1 Tax=Dreissena polymorpha TaxID=45954 RepID=A0A9D4JTT2_DREPO|nr:hypothetical protein DPMN_122099 [Dreissena polymorpha]
MGSRKARKSMGKATIAAMTALGKKIGKEKKFIKEKTQSIVVSIPKNAISSYERITAPSASSAIQTNPCYKSSTD